MTQSAGLRYKGELFDASANQSYMRNRQYEPMYGRFAQVDPARAGMNWYSFAGGDPVNHSDPAGKDWIWNKGPPGGWHWDGQFAGQEMSEDVAVANGFTKPTDDGDSPEWGTYGLPKDVEGNFRIGADIDFWYKSLSFLDTLGIGNLSTASDNLRDFATGKAADGQSVPTRNALAMINQLSQVAETQREALVKARDEAIGEAIEREEHQRMINEEGAVDISPDILFALDGAFAFARGGARLAGATARLGADALSSGGRALGAGFRGIGTSWGGSIKVEELLDHVRALKSARIINDGGSSVNRSLLFTDKQLQKKFKHASDFGVSGNFNKANEEAFKNALLAHTADKATVIIDGTYRGDKVFSFYNPNTGLNVIRDQNLNFVSGWKLSPAQTQHLLTTGDLGGGP